MFRSQKRWQLMIRTLQQQPGYGKFTRSLKVLTSAETTALPEDYVEFKGGATWVLEFFRWFPDVCELHTTMPLLRFLSISDLPSRQSLTQLHLRGEVITISQILEFLAFPKLCLLQFDYADFFLSREPILGEGHTSTNTVLQSLILGDRAYLCSRTLEAIIRRCPVLRVLKCSIPLDAIDITHGPLYS